MRKAIHVFVLHGILSVFEFSFCPVIFPVRFLNDCIELQYQAVGIKKLFIFCFSLLENKDKIICKEIISNVRALKMFLFLFKPSLFVCPYYTPGK